MVTIADIGKGALLSAHCLLDQRANSSLTAQLPSVPAK